MKKTIKYILLTFIGIIISCSSDTDTQGISSVTNFPIITLNGDDTLFIETGLEYRETGAEAIEGSSSIPVNISYDAGTYFNAEGVDTSSPDQYFISYSATNQDGFDGISSKTVWVAATGDFINSIEGLYISNVQRAPDFEVTDQYTDLEYVIIKRIGTDTYEITDAMGGYYDYGRGFGPDFACRGAIITADIPANSFSVSQAVFPVWGNTGDITEFTIDPSSKTISYTSDGDFANGTFKVQLTQVQL